MFVLVMIWFVGCWVLWCGVVFISKFYRFGVYVVFDFGGFVKDLVEIVVFLFWVKLGGGVGVVVYYVVRGLLCCCCCCDMVSMILEGRVMEIEFVWLVIYDMCVVMVVLWSGFLMGCFVFVLFCISFFINCGFFYIKFDKYSFDVLWFLVLNVIVIVFFYVCKYKLIFFFFVVLVGFYKLFDLEVLVSKGR